MQESNRKAKAALTLGAIAAISLAAAQAIATPGSGFSGAPISNGNFGALDIKADKLGHWDLLLKTKDQTDVFVNVLTVAPGGQSGWHSHPIPLLITVTEGSVRWTNGSDAACPTTTYVAGDSYVEPANQIHLVHNATGATARFVAVGFSPRNTPVRTDEAIPQTCPA